MQTVLKKMAGWCEICGRVVHISGLFLWHAFVGQQFIHMVAYIAKILCLIALMCPISGTVCCVST